MPRRGKRRAAQTSNEGAAGAPAAWPDAAKTPAPHGDAARGSAESNGPPEATPCPPRAAHVTPRASG
ncbi:polyphosphate kinase [Burkholderia pseudomallei]|uniref:Polyphosphate kinase n=3 Tax=Burkholderia pseudomallei TaxID=28450 RepID=A0AAX0UDQ0_BURPE|nr:conserved hypothetical protein [Burkholderia pseudomallei 1106a]ALB13128.1 polyphosphate kinase [Burkholderia pseudomallei]EEH27745.1 conserved hypothetical protein [Burkholderia pseudomallei Pakistan 9]EES25055.1 conserved hypothetical protein [Burkholderia pseudomallei 1106b]EET08584.1 conserved hypothetical protein [Burkholderia pseudomallei 1710a]